MVEGDNALSPCWTYLEWNSAEKKEQVSKQQPLKHQEVLTILDKMDLAIPLQGVLTNFRNTKRMDTGKDSEVIPFMISGLRHPSTADVHLGLQKLSGCSCMKLIASRLRPDRGQRPQLGEADGGGIHGDGLLRLGTAANAVGGPGRPPANAVSRSTRLNGSEGPRLPVAQLRNPDNICYANAALQVFYWLGVLTGQPAACYGRVQAGMPVLTATGSQYLACMHASSR